MTERKKFLFIEYRAYAFGESYIIIGHKWVTIKRVKRGDTSEQDTVDFQHRR